MMASVSRIGRAYDIVKIILIFLSTFPNIIEILTTVVLKGVHLVDSTYFKLEQITRQDSVLADASHDILTNAEKQAEKSAVTANALKSGFDKIMSFFNNGS